MTENKHEETREDFTARVESDTTTEADITAEADTEMPGKHVAVETTDDAEQADIEDTDAGDGKDSEPAEPKRTVNWSRVTAFAVLPALAFLLALAAGYLKFQDSTVRDGDIARASSVQAAKDGTVALLSYKPDTVEQQLTGARDLLSGTFRDSYTSLTNDVVIPGAKQQQISAVASVPAVASVSANPAHAVVLVFVNQTVVVGIGAPSDTASSVRVALDKVGDKWLISAFDPV